MSGELSKLTPPEGANQRNKRKGRGIGSGHGKTAGRGMKGQKARKSGQVRIGFEGGQMPIQRRLPKTGFKNPFTKRWAEVKLSDLESFEGAGVIDEAGLRAQGYVKGRWTGVKILATGELTKKVEVRVNRISKAAAAKIEALGGKIDLIADRPKWERADTRAKKRAAGKKQA